MDAERCVLCGAVIPEGRQVCKKCEMTVLCEHVWVYDGMVDGERGRHIDFKCQRCGTHRLGGVYGGRAVTYKEDKDDAE